MSKTINREREVDAWRDQAVLPEQHHEAPSDPAEDVTPAQPILTAEPAAEPLPLQRKRIRLNPVLVRAARRRRNIAVITAGVSIVVATAIVYDARYQGDFAEFSYTQKLRFQASQQLADDAAESPLVTPAMSTAVVEPAAPVAEREVTPPIRISRAPLAVALPRVPPAHDAPHTQPAAPPTSGPAPLTRTADVITPTPQQMVSTVSHLMGTHTPPAARTDTAVEDAVRVLDLMNGALRDAARTVIPVAALPVMTELEGGSEPHWLTRLSNHRR